MRSQVNFQALVTSCKGCRLYCAVLDGARDRRIYEKLQTIPARVASLYTGIDDVEDNEKWLYPYLVELRDNEFTQWLFECGWGNCWGIFVGTDVSFPQLRNHLAQLMFVSGRDDGKNYFFRFFDPSVLRRFMPTCNSAQLKKMFRHVTYYWMEKDDHRPTYFYHRPIAADTPKNYNAGEAPYGRDLPLVF